MNSNPVAQDAVTPPPIDFAVRRRGRRTMLLILAVSVAPILAAWLTFYVWRPEGGASYGELLNPPQALDLGKAQALGSKDALALQGKWVLLTVAEGACDAACRSHLHDTRQVHTALSKEMSRVARAWLISDTAALAAGLPEPSDADLVVLRAQPGALAVLPGQVYVRDPLGNLILRYPPEMDGKRLLKDLNRLLKYSPLGTS